MKKSLGEAMTLQSEWDKKVQELQFLPIWTLEEGLQVLAYFKCQEEVATKDHFPGKFESEWQRFFSFALADYRGALPLLADFEITTPRGQVVPNSCACRVEPVAFLEWARIVGGKVPDEFLAAVTSAKEMRAKLTSEAKSNNKAEDVVGCDLTAKERRRLGQLEREKEKWDIAIQAAVDLSIYCLNLREGTEITRAIVEDFLHKKKYSLPSTTVEKLWKALPGDFKSKGGRPKKIEKTP